MPQQKSKPNYAFFVKRRPNFPVIGLFAAFLFCFTAGAVHLVRYTVHNLTDFLLYSLEINDFYVYRMIGVFMGVCLTVLMIILFMVDGETHRLRKFITKYMSKLVVKNYYSEDGQRILNPEVSPEQMAWDASSRAAASIRPKASAIEDAYRQGDVNGTFKEFYPNGALKREVHYLDGALNGLFRTYYENGQLEQESVYRDGLIDGEYRSYYESGKSHQEKQYIGGELDGVYKAYDEFGVPFFEITYKLGVQHGPDQTYDQMGVLQYVDTYREGRLINRKTYNEYGVLKFDQDFREDEAYDPEVEPEDIVSTREEEEKRKRAEKRREK